MRRLVILSNRIPTGATPSGGLIVALHDCLTAQGGVWIGSAEEQVAEPAESLTLIGEGPYARKTFDLTPEEHEGFYLGYANSVLWPLFHWRADLIEVSAESARAYAAVNARVARLIAQELRPDDLLWVHDYHFLPVARALRSLGVTNRIGFFLHTPFPHAHDLLALPERAEFTDWLAAFDLVGLQAERDVSALLELFRSSGEAEMMLDGTLRHENGRFAVRSFPIGIDVADFAEQALRSTGAHQLRLSNREKLIVGVDRMDYSKGLVQRFEAFGRYLDTHAAPRPRATFLQIAQPSRSAIDAYQALRANLEAKTGHLNGAHGTLSWTPIRLLCRSVARETIAGVYRRADVGLVTPLADGMNLVAKEYVAAQDPDDPGVLILSHFAGAAERMTEALLVNPYDTAEVSDAIARAIDMTLDERIARHRALLDEITAHDIGWWTRTYLDKLGRATEGRAALAGAR